MNLRKRTSKPCKCTATSVCAQHLETLLAQAFDRGWHAGVAQRHCDHVAAERIEREFSEWVCRQIPEICERLTDEFRDARLVGAAKC